MSAQRASYGNGDKYVRRAELTAHLDPIHEDVSEVKADVKLVRDRLHTQSATLAGITKLLAASAAVQEDREKRSSNRFGRREKVGALLLSTLVVFLQVHPVHF